MFNFIGKVINQKNIPIKNAKVSFEGLGTPFVNYTDGEGVFRFQIKIISGNIVNGNISVEAEGYKHYNRYVELSTDNKNFVEIRLVENDIENSSKPPVAITVAKIGLMATVIAALISGAAMLLSNGKIPTPQSTPKSSIKSINSSPDSSQKSRRIVEFEVSDMDTQQLLSNVDVELRPSTGQTVTGKTNRYGYLTLSVSEQNENMLEARLTKENYKPLSTLIDISTKKKHKLTLGQKGLTRTPVNHNSQGIGTPDSNTSIPTNSANTPLIKGLWEINMEVTNDTDFYKNGSLRMESIRLLAAFEEKNNEFEGYIKDAPRGVCQGTDETNISGSVKGNDVYWKVKYPSKCCHGAEMVFNGRFDVSTGKITGKLKPTTLSSSNTCTLIQAKVDMRLSGS